MLDIYVTPEDIWDYYEDNKKDLEKCMHKIAENKEFGVIVYLTDDYGFPGIIVEADDKTVYTDFVATPKDCADVVSEVYENFLSYKAVQTLANIDIVHDDDEPEVTLPDLEDEIEERELEIEDALWAFLDDVLGGDATLEIMTGDEMFEDIKEHFLEYLARVHGLPVRRPMFLTDENGEDFFEEYPYEHMIFDDEK